MKKTLEFKKVKYFYEWKLIYETIIFYVFYDKAFNSYDLLITDNETNKFKSLSFFSLSDLKKYLSIWFLNNKGLKIDDFTINISFNVNKKEVVKNCLRSCNNAYDEDKCFIVCCYTNHIDVKELLLKEIEKEN